MRYTRASLIGLLAVVLGGGARAHQLPQHPVPYSLHTGLHDGAARSAVAGEARLVFEQEVAEPGAKWLRLGFGDAELGRASYLVMASVEDGGVQVLDADGFERWSRTSAYFDGDRVLLQLWVAPGDRDVFAELVMLRAGDPPPPQEETLCGADSRIASNDNRVGRIGGCTAWRATNGAFLCAGHCVDSDPDGCGPLLPDGVPTSSLVVSFNVPASDPDGSANPADEDDQYPMIPSTLAFNFDGSCQGLGKDWAVFGVEPNENTGLLPHEAYGLPFRVTRENPAAGDTIRVTGFGSDNTPPGSTGGANARNRTNQTSTGDYVSETNNGGDIYHRYRTDTAAASSGSPVIWSGLVIGVHTNGGCTSVGGSNSGTSFEHNPLDGAMQTFPGPVVRYADVGHPLPVVESGSVFRPFDTVVEAVHDVPNGGIVSVVAGTYTAAAGNVFTVDRPMTLQAPCGTVTIGL